ncbi:hypothetical protein F5888DRAFT_1683520 [Russula emetica]|nr:hypothetical protein F5888DRAFT_1683520 [Russula emetica]
MIMVLPPRLPPAVVHPVIRGAHIATASGYLSTAGLAALLYDHVLTFGDEVNLIWTAPRSFPKWVFLTNHYLAEVCLIAVANEEPGLNGHLSDQRCQKFVAAVTCYAMISTFVANLLGFVRVIILWDKSPRVVLGLSIALTMSFLATITSTVASIIYTEPTVRYDPSLKLCYPTKSSKSFAIIWATPLLAFDITVLAFMIYNSLSNPRDLKTTLKGILYRDGILFFLLVALIRALNLLLVIVTEPDLAGFPAYFSWAIITLACRHLLIHIHSCEQEADLYATRPSSMETDSEPAIKLHSYKVNCH